MKSMWALINDNDEWDRVCHQSANEVPSNDLEKVGNFSDVPWEQTDERLYYAPLCTTMNQLLDLCNAKYTMKVTRFNPETQQSTGMTPDLCMYDRDPKGLACAAFTLPSAMEENNLAEDVVDTSDEDNKQGSSQTLPQAVDAIRPYQARTAWAWMTMLVKVKADLADAPYAVDKDGKLALPRTQAARKSRVQIVKYASEVFLRQHRTFFFTAVLVTRKAYLMRWDRAGAIVTTPFDYIDEPTKLLRFLYRIAVAERSLQGYDSTVTLASEEDAEAFRQYRHSLNQEPDVPQASELPEIPNFLRDYVNESLVNETFYPIHKVICYEPPNLPHIPPGSETSCKTGAAAAPLHPASTPVPPRGPAYTYLVGKHRHGTRSPNGRGGKGFVAFDMEHRRSVFLKDYWYANHPTVHPETEVYQKLRKAGVQYVATLIAGGDVLDCSGAQETLSQTYLTGERRRRRHHRLVTKEIGRPLESYRGNSELIVTLYEALTAHRDAYKKADILHRDISVANILIDVQTGRIFLNDWDLCKYVTELTMKASQHARWGTWPYMSATLVEYPCKPNELADDIESFLHVFSIVILRFCRHSLTKLNVKQNSSLTTHLNATYYGAEVSNSGLYVGLKKKKDMMLKGDPGFYLDNANSMLADLLERLFKLGAEHYAGIDLTKLARQWGAEPPDADQVQPFLMAKNTAVSFHGHPRPRTDRLTTQAPAHALPAPSISTSIAAAPAAIGQPNSSIRGSSQGTLRHFNNHTHIMTIFEAIFQKYDGTLEELDKTPDQLNQVWSLTLRGEDTSSLSSKRRSDDLEI